MFVCVSMCAICAYYVNLYARYCEPIPCTLELALKSSSRVCNSCARQCFLLMLLCVCTEHAETRRELEGERQALMHTRLDLDATQVYQCVNTCMDRACFLLATLLAILRDLDICIE